MMKLSYVTVVLLLCSAIMAGQDKSGTNQPVKTAPPSVAAAAVPLYPPLARMARIEGIVHVKVTTDGHRVIATQAEDGHKMLVAAAESNAKTWEFSTHEPTTFTVTYEYKLVVESKENPYGPTVTLRLPTEVEVVTTPILISDPAPDPRPAKKKSDNSLIHESGHAEGMSESVDPKTGNLHLTIPVVATNKTQQERYLIAEQSACPWCFQAARGCDPGAGEG